MSGIGFYDKLAAVCDAVEQVAPKLAARQDAEPYNAEREKARLKAQRQEEKIIAADYAAKKAEGAKAFDADKKITDNPYGGRDGTGWALGWYDARTKLAHELREKLSDGPHPTKSSMYKSGRKDAEPTPQNDLNSGTKFADALPGGEPMPRSGHIKMENVSDSTIDGERLQAENMTRLAKRTSETASHPDDHHIAVLMHTNAAKAHSYAAHMARGNKYNENKSEWHKGAAEEHRKKIV